MAHKNLFIAAVLIAVFLISFYQFAYTRNLTVKKSGEFFGHQLCIEVPFSLSSYCFDLSQGAFSVLSGIGLTHINATVRLYDEIRDPFAF